MPAVVLLLAFSLTSQQAAARPPDYQELVDKLDASRLKEQIAASEAAKSRHDVEKLQAEIQARRLQERDEARKKRQTLLLIVEQKRWALAQFEPGARGLIPKSDRVPQYMLRWQRARELAKQQFLEFPERSRGSIKTGNALNFFLDACGPTALDHQVYREQLTQCQLIVGQSRSRNPEDLNKELGDRLDILGSDRSAIPVRLKLLEEIAGPRLFGAHDLRKVYVQKGLAGPKLKMRLNTGPLPLDWPREVRFDPEYAPHCEALGKTKEEALKALAEGQPIPIDLQQRMMEEVDALCGLCESKVHEHFSQVRESLSNGGAPSAETANQFTVARRFMRELRGGVVRFIEAADASDVQVSEFPPEGERVGSDQILAFMCRHGLRFAESDINGEVVYENLFRHLSRYYVDLYGLHLAIQADERNIEAERAEDMLYQATGTVEKLLAGARLGAAMLNGGFPEVTAGAER
jgi:hypothetical protein